MAETNPEVPKVVQRKGSSLKKRVALTVAAAGTAAIGFLGVDKKEARPISAAGETPTATPTRTATSTPTVTLTPTPTPDARDQRMKALQTVVAAAEAGRKIDEIITGLEARATALAQSPTTTPTRTATPKPVDTPRPTDTPVPTATLDAVEAKKIRDAAVVKELADRKEAALKEAELTAAPTGTAIAQKTAAAEAVKPRPTNIPEGRGGGGVDVHIPVPEIPGGSLGGVGAGVALSAVYFSRRRIGNGIRGLAGLPSRGITWVRNWLGGGGAGGGPGPDSGPDGGEVPLDASPAPVAGGAVRDH